MPMRAPFAAALFAMLLSACASTPKTDTRSHAAPVAVPPVKVGIALGGGAAKGFAHIGVIKMLEANGIVPAVRSDRKSGG